MNFAEVCQKAVKVVIFWWDHHDAEQRFSLDVAIAGKVRQEPDCEGEHESRPVQLGTATRCAALPRR